MIEIHNFNQTQFTPVEYSKIIIDPNLDVSLLKSALEATFEFAQKTNQRIVLDRSVESLPDYSHDCVWSVRHSKDSRTDLKIKLKAMEIQSLGNTGEEIHIIIQQ